MRGALVRQAARGPASSTLTELMGLSMESWKLLATAATTVATAAVGALYWSNGFSQELALLHKDFVHHGARFDRVESRVDARLDKVEQSVEALRQEQGSLRGDIKELARGMDTLRGEMRELARAVTAAPPPPDARRRW